MFQYSKLITALFVLLFLCEPSRADLVVQIGDLGGVTYIEQGSVGYVDVYVRSDQPLGDYLSSFGFEFGIGPEAGVASRLRFTDPQPDPQLTDPNYVFVVGPDNFSGVLDLGMEVGSVLGIPPGSQFLGGDFHKDFDDVVVPNSNKLLVRLQLEPDWTLQDTPAIGDTFVLSSGFEFFDSQFDDVLFTVLGAPHRIEIIASSTEVIPEPSSFLLAGVLACATLFLRRRRAAARRKQTCFKSEDA